MDSPSAPTTTTTILDLNDDCLLDVFQYFEIRELLPLVDVCQRFRQISQRHFASMPSDAWEYQNIDQMLFRPEKKIPLRFYRLFGPLLRSVSLHRNSRIGPQVDSPEYEMNMIQLLNTYCCSKTLIELILGGWNLTSEVTGAMRPWFQRLERLTIKECKLSDSFLQLTFEKLTFCCSDMHIDEMGKFLKSNPQLKQIKFGGNRLNDRMFQYIANQVSGIESIGMGVINRTGGSNMQCLGKLSKLKSLQLSESTSNGPDEFADSSSAVLREISGANIPLEKLHLSSFDQPTVADQLIDEISKLKTLKILRWEGGVPCLNRGHIIQLCENLTELSELRLETSILPFDGYFYLNAELILEIVGNARKLQSLYCYSDQDQMSTDVGLLVEKCLINADTYMKMVRMVEQRREICHLSVILGNCGYAANIPPELTKYHADTLTLVVSKNHKLFECDYFKL